MKKRGKIGYLLGIIVCIGLGGSCDNGFFQVTSRSAANPVAVVPRVSSFASLSGISVSWDADVLADSYIVYRKQLPGGDKEVVYRGTDCQYVDPYVENKQVYLYSLAKVRGTKEFDVGTAVPGAFDSIHVADSNGNNNTKEHAIPFNTAQITDMVFYYGARDNTDNHGYAVEDIDWYYVDLAIKTQMDIQLNYVTDDNGTADLATDSDSDLDKAIADGQKITVKNGTDYPKRCYFCVHRYNSAMDYDTKYSRIYDLSFVALMPYSAVTP